MTAREMLHYTNRLKEIRNIKNTNIRDNRLANMMSDLESQYDIPALRNSSRYAEVDPFVMQLYHTVSDERTFEKKGR